MRRLLLAGTILAGLLASSQSIAQGASAPATPDRDPEAMAALDKMGAALRKLSTAEVRADITSEEVLASGQKLQFGGTATMTVVRPNKLRATIHTSRHDREIYYNGSNLTLYSPSLGYYASFKTPGTIRETIALAGDRYDIQIPLFELADWGADQSLAAKVQTAFRVGSDAVNGKICTHYAVRQPGVDWQIWLNEAGDSLPCKLVITNRLDPAMPQYSSTYTWLQPRRVAPADFNFTPPKGAHEIAIATVEEEAAAKGEK